LGGEAAIEGSRLPEIMADAAHHILIRPSRETTGNFFIDQDVLLAAGVTDLSRYAVSPGREPTPDLFL
jgi:citronellol/citronellal dehydrogenase